jgi:8-oxo-dGTP pyrophosphatase MutT (NUDIX family)
MQKRQSPNQAQKIQIPRSQQGFFYKNKYLNSLDLANFEPGKYCLNCLSKKVAEKNDKKNQLYYLCGKCSFKSSRVIQIDRTTKLKKTKSGWTHFTAGALIVDDFNNPKKYLIIKKRKHPYLYDVIAGHIEKNELPLIALKREVKEEAGAEIAKQKLLLKIIISPDPCRRGIDIHQWHLYLCSLKTKINPDPDEINEIKWYCKKDLKKLRFVLPTEKTLKLLKII